MYSTSLLGVHVHVKIRYYYADLLHTYVHIHTTTVYTSVFEYCSIKRSQLQPSFDPPFKFLKDSGIQLLAHNIEEYSQDKQDKHKF